MPLNAADIVPEIPLGKAVSVVGLHAEGLVALEKPCSILSHPNSETDNKRSLLTASWSKDRERYMWKVGNKSYRLYLLHRLDSATSGVLIGCVNPNLARELKAQFSKRRVSKTYFAIVLGRATDKELTWRDLLRKRRSRSGIRMDAIVRDGSPAESRMTLIEARQAHPKLSMLKLKPITGRTHQLRVQAAKRQLPIVGDGTYGNFKFNRKVHKSLGEQRLFLHAASIKIQWEWNGRRHQFYAESKLPDSFQQLMGHKFPDR